MTYYGSIWWEEENPPSFLTMCRISVFYMAPVGLPPHSSLLGLLSLPQVRSVTAILLQRLQVFDIDLIIWHWSQRRGTFTYDCCNMEAVLEIN